MEQEIQRNYYITLKEILKKFGIKGKVIHSYCDFSGKGEDEIKLNDTLYIEVKLKNERK